VVTGSDGADRPATEAGLAAGERDAPLERVARRRLESISERYGLESAAVAAIESLLISLAADERSPTSIKLPAEAVDVHVADSLVALELGILPPEAGWMVDVGSGAGFPGLPLAAAMSGAEVCLLESQARKCAFIECSRELAGIGNARTVRDRAESWEEGRGRAGAVLARALAAQSVVLEYAAPLLAMGGVLVDWRGRRDPEAESAAQRAAELLGLQRLEVRAVQPFPESTDRHVHVFEKVDATPPRFPRRPGAAAKRPLGV
jgi:16S rRNA (guanine527-N7)-methyltransferase